MKEIQKTAIIGMGALGLLYGEQIQNALGKEAVAFVMDEARYERHKDEVYQINGKTIEFQMRKCTEMKPVELVIIATKGTGLESALEVCRPCVGEDTIIISVLNGISSEKIIASRFDSRQVLGCVAIGMDAMREGSKLEYCSKGRLQIGVLEEEQEEMLFRLTAFFDRIGQSYEVKKDIMQAMWGKFLLNVGINQACTVYQTTYAGALKNMEIRENMIAAMREVLHIAEAEGIELGEEDLERDLQIIGSLKADGYPSMRQDAIAGRPGEVDMFAGTVMQIAQKHGIPVPVNTYYYHVIKEAEAKYENAVHRA